MFVLASFLTLPGCGGNSSVVPPPNNPVPSITSLTPAAVAAGSASQTLTIAGSGFITASTVTFNGVAHTAHYDSASQILFTLSAADQASIGMVPVVVANPAPGGGSSNSANFNVETGTPTGTFNITVTASSGSLTHNTTFTLVVQ